MERNDTDSGNDDAKHELQGVPNGPYSDTKWHGVPPAGRRPLPKKWVYLLQITAVLIVEFIIWAIYRNLTADFYGKFGTYWFYIGHIFAAPLIHLGPILVFWVLIRKEQLFYKNDKEEGSAMSFVFGPFKFTRKLLLTAVIVGLLGGIVWRVTEMLVSNTTSVVLGGSRFGTLTLFNIYTQSEFALFLLMTFVMFFIVGPVEEMEFRSFTFDQSNRVLPQWQSLAFSSIFFGLSHIPIAIFVYKLSPIDLIFAEISWMSAGVVFGALYMWSRNIFACIVMHGIGNWQLSVFLWQGETMGAGLTPMGMNIVSLVTSLLANGAIIAVFYLIHRYYWEPQRNGEAAFGGKLFKLQSAIFSHDNGTRKPIITATILSVVTVLLLSVMVAGTVGIGTKDMSSLSPEVKVKDKGVLDLSLYETINEVTTNEVPFMNVGSTFDVTVASSETMIVKKVMLEVSWNDETTPPGRPRLRPYTNQPDSFSATLTFGNRSISELGINPQGGEGTVSIELEVNDTDIISLIGNYTVIGSIKMEAAGIWTTIGFLGLRDDGNTCSYQLDVEYLVPKQEGGNTPSPDINRSY
ncbi:MAG: CPBP family intramembrane metalloprotease [Candidatus Thermoplasmatota archaeon]|jgi:membrane protease YdiL (CAAX protease family)|nr:CPBP family intramembrane metalloprotease [Candidatus Thermoplasmatota archaeon]